MKVATLRAAVLGCGRIGARTSPALRQRIPRGWLPLSHAEALQSLPDIELVALCDINEERLVDACSDFNIRSGYTDYREMIQKEVLDIVSVATRTAIRPEIISYAAENGVRAVHAEKPISRNMLDCNRIMDVVRQHSVLLSYGTTRRYMDVYRTARELLLNGEIGQLLQITVEHGRTALMWNHPHSVDLLLFFSGCTDVSYVQSICLIDPSEVVGDNVDCDPIVEYAFVKFSNGVNGTIVAGPGMNVRLLGTNGTITVGADGSWIELWTRSSPCDGYFLRSKRFEVDPQMSGTQRAFSELAAALRYGGAVSINLEEIELSQRMLLGFVLSSSRGGSKISPAAVPDELTVTGRSGLLYA